MDITDVFDVNDRNSTIRSVLEKESSIDLKQFEVPIYKVKPEFETRCYKFDPDNYDSKMREVTTHLTKPVLEKGFKQGIFSAIYEALRNAHQHGNKKMPDKKIIVHRRFEHRKAEFLVEDQGGEIKTPFLGYIQRFRQRIQEPVNFYNFSGLEKSSENLGAGTMLIHSYADAVNYFKSENGGLILRMKFIR